MTPPDIAPKHADLQIDEQGTPQELLAKLDELADQDKKAESRVKLWKGIFWGGVVTAIVMPLGLSVVAPIILSIGGGVGGRTGLIVALVIILLMVLLFVGSIVAIIVGAKRRKAAENRDVEDRKLQLPERLLWLLGPELDQGKPARLWIDFRAHDQAEGCGRVLGQRDISSLGLAGAVTREAFHHPWLWLTLRLADGTGLTLQAITTAKRKTTSRATVGTKKSKHKLKKKEKVREQLWVLLSPPRGGSFSPQIQQNLSQIGAPPGMRLKRCKVSGKQASFLYECQTVYRTHQTTSAFLDGAPKGWQGQGAENLLHGTNTLQAIIVSYKALALVTQPYQG